VGHAAADLPGDVGHPAMMRLLKKLLVRNPRERMTASRLASANVFHPSANATQTIQLTDIHTELVSMRGIVNNVSQVRYEDELMNCKITRD
jgi:hypothetical protein